MRNSFYKSIAGGFAALTMAAMAISSASPAGAVMIHGGGFHGGGFGGGFHGAGVGGFHPTFGGGFHPGFRPGFVGFHPRFFGFHRRFFHPVFVNGVWINSGWGGYGNTCWDYRPVYDAWGNFLGQQNVNLCQY
jgi:hypothetical protein